MITISLCMIVKNEEKVLARCLDSIQSVVDEIIIVDTGSDDATKEIAKRYTDKVYDFAWIDDFSAARNYAFSKATMDYQMWLDADDVVPAGEAEKMKELKRTLPEDTDIVTMKYHVHFDNFDNPTMTSMRERLTKREKQYIWSDPVHECIPLIGNVHHADIAIEHRKEHTGEVSWRNINIYKNLEKQNHKFSPRQLYYYARELKDHNYYKKAAKYFKKFLDTKQGWREDNINACRELANCYKRLGKDDKCIKALLRSFEYDSPRSEAVCEIAYYYKEKKEYKQAAQWFLIASKLEKPESYCFMSGDYWGYIPHIELCVCYSILGDMEKAVYHNDQAAVFKPESKAVKHNRAYFAKQKQ